MYKQSCTPPPLSEGQSACPHPPPRPPFLIWTMASRLNLSSKAEDHRLPGPKTGQNGAPRSLGGAGGPAPTPAAVSKETGLTSDPEVAAKQQGPGCLPHPPPRPPAPPHPPPTPLGLHLEEELVREQRGNENSKSKEHLLCGRHYSRAFPNLKASCSPLLGEGGSSTTHLTVEEAKIDGQRQQERFHPSCRQSWLDRRVRSLRPPPIPRPTQAAQAALPPTG